MRTTLLVLAILIGFLALAVAASLYLWSGFGDVQMSANGIIALILGAVLTFIVGAGLMALVFYSHRAGHDERAHSAGLDRDRR